MKRKANHDDKKKDSHKKKEEKHSKSMPADGKTALKAKTAHSPSQKAK